jgi:transposase
VAKQMSELDSSKQAAIVLQVQAGALISDIAKKFEITTKSISDGCSRLRRRGFKIKRVAYTKGQRFSSEIERLLEEAGVERIEGNFRLYIRKPNKKGGKRG